ncbi:hypothetical protein WSM22_10290 [Cytophagales bacterium WSM2-2]|nr:hypothetical protein WSM22_10290 [Cytophagales bacterium WSM2-2]
MVDVETARTLCLSLPEANEYDHFDKPAYRVKKKIFATLWLDDQRAVLKLSKAEQPELCEAYPTSVFPVKGAWGKLGWTYVDLSKVTETALKKLLMVAWTNVAPKMLIKKSKKKK